jgi:NAD-dependent dihydropyrimidine dehydrogenase PreA subunit
MIKLEDHPTVKHFFDNPKSIPWKSSSSKVDADWLRTVCLESGADDVGFVEIDLEEIRFEKEDILSYFPRTKTLISFVCRMNREPIRSPGRSVANLEFHHTGDKVNEVAREIVSELENEGVRAINPSMGFPMEMDRFPGKIWIVSHKTVAVAAGLGQMGIHRNVIHPKFGNFILLGTILMDTEVTAYHRPIDYNPCLECKLCVAACPTGAIGADGYFNFSACYTHNYREFIGGFTDWVEKIADSRDAVDYRQKVTDAESASMWQSLSFGANYKAAYCMAVCPAGEDVIGPFLTDRPGYLKDVVRPLQEKKETVYVNRGSDAESYVHKRFPHKKTKVVGSGIKPTSIRGFIEGLPLVFQRNQSDGINATYHFTFTGEEPYKATVAIRDKTLRVNEGHTGSADIHITADSKAWLGFLRKEKSIIWSLLTRKVRVKGSLRLLKEFAKCFPS